MDEREELKQKLKSELQWVKYRIRMLDIIEEKLVQMRNMAEVDNKSLCNLLYNDLCREI